MLKYLGPFCLAAWLILMGLLQAFKIDFKNKDMIMGILAIIAGVTMLLTLL
ncbi:MAG TPA: hypothetical protein PKD86_15665 [Gemmatales bacterium]|nr:hypothetical protein [Gemmatales bacterium]HMP60782.1 hypothetical protein [Gemmatales bacterium]